MSILVIWDDDANQFDKQVIANRFFNIAASMWEIQQESTQAVITVVHIFLISIQYVDVKTIPQKTKKKQTKLTSPYVQSFKIDVNSTQGRSEGGIGGASSPQLFEIAIFGK